jgi:beta-1,4-mannosyltransferase
MPEGELSICAWPATLANNATHDMLYSELAKLGVRVVPYSQPGVLGERFEVLHIHWPDTWLHYRSSLRARYRTALEFFVLKRLKRRGVKIVWTVHNLQSHDRRHPALEARFWKRFPAMADAFIVLTEASREPVLAQFPDLRSKPGFVVPHGHYRDAYANTISAAEARRRLGFPENSVVLSHVGILKPYKNVVNLIRTFRGLPDPNLRLAIGGAPGGGLTVEAIQDAAGDDARIRLDLRRLADDELQVFLNAADLVPLPFAEILNSGSAILALSFDRPILVPLRGSMGELVTVAGPEFVRTYEGEFDQTQLESAIAWAKNRTAERAPLDHLGWDRVAEQTMAVYRAVRGLPN